MNNKEIEQLIKIITETDIYEFELEKPNSKVKIKRGHASRQVAVQEVVSGGTVHLTAEKAAAPIEEAVEQDKNVRYIISPMVGTFYRSPSPDSQPYINTGDVINKGQVLCIIEAMKLFNEIESDVNGKVVKILVENGAPVEYGEKLFSIDVS